MHKKYRRGEMLPIHFCQSEFKKKTGFVRMQMFFLCSDWNERVFYAQNVGYAANFCEEHRLKTKVTRRLYDS